MRLTQSEIERQTTMLLRQQGVFCAANPIAALAPRTAIELMGYEFIEVNSLDWPPVKDSTSWGGQIDRQARRVSIATKFAGTTQYFTTAHELAHIVLHGEYESARFHRDIPLTGANRSKYKPVIEREADSFAGFYLMPRTLLQKSLNARFGATSLANVDWGKALAFHLAGSNHHHLLRGGPVGRRNRALAIATASHLSYSHFQSLADEYKVSPEAMAIQLEVIGAVL